MSPEEREQQETIHQALDGCLPLDDGEVLAGWVIVYETVNASEPGYGGHVYGPSSMTTWRALGLVEWARRFCLRPDDDEDDDS